MKAKITYYSTLIVFFILLSYNSSGQFYNGSYQEFGKNRVQETTFFWQYYDFERFKVYFYGDGATNVEYAAKSIHKNLQELELFFETQVDSKFDVLVFNKQTDFKQSNVGLTNELTSNIGGKNSIVGNKIFLYFEQDHPDFDKQIREALTEALVSRMVNQTSWKQVVRNSSSVEMPYWFSEGLYSYMGENWSATIETEIKDGINSGRFDKLGRLENIDAKYAGHAMWNYIAQVYGDEVIPQIIYLLSVSRSFESSFRFVLGKSTKSLNNDFVRYYKKSFEEKDENKTIPLQQEISIKRRKKKGKITQFALSPDGTKLAYTANEIGKYKVWIYDISSKSYTKVRARGFKAERATDESFPLLDWHPNGNTLAFVEETDGEVYFNFYDLESKKTTKRAVQNVTKVTSFSYNETGSQFVFSGIQKGQIDLYLYTIIGNGYKKLTDDFSDDRDPRFIENSTKIIFSSNRKNDSLYVKAPLKPTANLYDIYIYDLNKKFQPTLKRVTNTPTVNELFPYELERFKYTYLSDENGLINRYVAVFDSVIASVDTVINYRYFSKSSELTNYKKGISSVDYSDVSSQLGMVIKQDNEYLFYKGDISMDKISDKEIEKGEKKSETKESDKRKSTVEIISVKPNIKTEETIEISNYQFEQKKPKVEETKKEDLVFLNPDNSLVEKEVITDEFKLPTRKLYNINFTLDEVTSQIDNNFLNGTYQVFNPNNPSFNNQNVNLFNMVQIKDLMEDYRLIGGVNLSFNLQDNDYLLSFEDLSQRFDKKYLFTRQAYSTDVNFIPVRTRIHEFKYRLKYPFNEISSLAVTFNLRNDNTIVSALNRQTLEAEGTSRNMGGAKIEYVLDNTFDRGINLREGTRLKVFGEYYQEIYEAETDFFVIGTDIRHYQKIHREMIFAGRIAASTSFGNRKLVYYMGGVDGWLGARANESIIIPTDKGFAFQTIATPMRGFLQTKRFGNSFAVANSEVRWPIFEYFSEYPVQSKFLSTFQVVGFADAGTAWTGSNPYSEENSFNITQISQKPINVIIQNQREPIIFGYGFGLRAELFGYFVRYDWSWGVEDGVVQGRINYFSLSLDF
ncbi:hypothetical protein OAD98_00335 [Flavobacteriales bacterium]|nr:hypothetical protein [Flavobacteriales bacterium]